MIQKAATDVLLSIHAQMDGQEWSPDTLDAIADILNGCGLTVRSPEEMEEDHANLLRFLEEEKRLHKEGM